MYMISSVKFSSASDSSGSLCPAALSTYNLQVYWLRVNGRTCVDW